MMHWYLNAIIPVNNFILINIHAIRVCCNKAGSASKLFVHFIKKITTQKYFERLEHDAAQHRQIYLT